MHHHDCPPQHVVDYAKIALMERDLWGETYHHSDPHCRCDDCKARRLREDRELQEQTLRAEGRNADDLARLQRQLEAEERRLTLETASHRWAVAHGMSEDPGSVTS